MSIRSGQGHPFDTLLRFMAHLESVEILDAKRSRWVARAPAHFRIEWQAEITADCPGECIAWKSLEGSQVVHSGVVRFVSAPRDQGTEVCMDMQYEPPAGKLGPLIAKAFGEEPAQQINGDLRRFKQFIELGDIVHSDASIARGLHAGQPSA